MGNDVTPVDATNAGTANLGAATDINAATTMTTTNTNTTDTTTNTARHGQHHRNVISDG